LRDEVHQGLAEVRYSLPHLDVLLLGHKRLITGRYGILGGHLGLLLCRGHLLGVGLFTHGTFLSLHVSGLLSLLGGSLGLFGCFGGLLCHHLSFLGLLLEELSFIGLLLRH
jgi:hypothetical protein